MTRAYRLLLVDDEPLAREHFRCRVPWENHGYEIAAEAENGEEALELLKHTEIDIVVTDIVMPRMSGLDLTKALKQARPHIPVIILSNYQEFEFARKALTLGASDYLLKVATDAGEVLAVLDKAAREVDEANARAGHEIANRQQYLKSIPVIRGQWLKDLLQRTFTGEKQLAGSCEYLRLHPFTDAFTVAIIAIDRYNELQSRYPAHDLSLFKLALMKMLDEIVSARCNGNLFPWTNRQLVLLIHWSSAQQPNAGQLDFLYSAMIRNVKRYLPFRISVGSSGRIELKVCGNRVESIARGLETGLSQAQDMLKEKFYTGKEYVVYGGQAPLAYAPLNEAVRNEFRNVYLTANPKLGEAALERILRERVAERVASSRFAPDEVTRWLLAATDELCKDASERTRFAQRIADIESVDEIGGYLCELVAYAGEHGAADGSADRYRDEIKKALDYIARHYDTPLSVQQVSEYVRVNPKYFSYLFKKETGQNYIDYVTDYRIRQAKRLLRETSLQVQEISMRVGIADYKYFTRLFRKMTGESPSAYREKREHS